jgi:putative membrane protein
MSDLLSTIYPWTKALHIVSVISWMAEKATVGSELDQTFQIMEHKLLYLIMRPAMIASWLFGLLLVLTPGVIDWSSIWPWVKAGSVIGMTYVHYWLALRRREFAEGKNTRTGRTYRMINEVPTVLMLLIVFAVILKF